MSTSVEFIYLSAEDVIACGGGDLEATMAACEEAFRLFERGECKELPTGKIAWNGEHAHRAGPKVAFVGGDVNAVAVKWIPANPDNPRERNLPRAIAQIILTDPISVLPRAIMDGTVISAIRTAAVGGIFAKYLARKDARAVGVIGTGPIGRQQLRAIGFGMEAIDRVVVYDLVRANSERFVDEHQPLFPNVEFSVAESARACVEACDVISAATVTAPADAYLEYEWLRPGAVVICTSGNDVTMEAMRRVPRLVFSFSNEKPGNRLRSDARMAYEEGILPSEKLVHISEIIAGSKPARLHEDDAIVSLPMGMGIMDVVNAQRVYETAVAQGIGQRLPLWHQTPWI